MNRSLLDAYLCRNLGDDLMILELCGARPETDFVAPDLSGGTGPTLEALPNLSVPTTGRWTVGALRLDGYVLCGGSMFIDRKGRGIREQAALIRRMLRRIAVAATMRVRRRPVEVIGCNLGPIETRIGRLLFALFLRLATRVTVRDKLSKTLACELGVRRPILAPDMVFSYLANAWPIARRPERSGGALGISVMPWPGLSFNETCDEYLSLLGQINHAFPGRRIKLLGLQDAIVRDDELISDIVRRSEPTWNIDIAQYDGKVSDFLDEFSSCERLLAVRFHSAILALGMGIPMVVLAYSEKTRSMLKDVQWEGDVWATSAGVAAEHGPAIVRALGEARALAYLPPEAARHAR